MSDNQCGVKEARPVGCRQIHWLAVVTLAALVAAAGRAEAASSSNIVGYVDLELPAGWCLIGQPFVVADTGLPGLLPAVPDGTAFYKWDSASAGWSIFTYDLAVGGWDPPGGGLGLADGGFIVLPAATRVTFAGDVPLGTWNYSYPTGYSLMLPPVTHPMTDFPATPGVLLYMYLCGASGGYTVTSYDDGFGEWDPFVPSFGLGEAALLYLNTPRVWTTTYQTPAAGSPAWRLLPPVRAGADVTLEWTAPAGAAPADVFYKQDLRSPASWTLLGRSALGQSQMHLSGFMAPSAFFVLGTLPDADGDGLPDDVETLLGLNPNQADTDGDGLPDGWELRHGLNARRATGRHGAAGDFDSDGRSNLTEYQQGAHPGDGFSGDNSLVRLDVFRPN